MQRLQNGITIATIQQQTASKEGWVILENMKTAMSKVMQYTQMQVGGFGAIEKVSWAITNKQEEIQNASEEELETLKEQLRVLYEKEAILKHVNDPYKEAILLARAGSEEWKQHYKDRIANLTEWIDAEKGTETQRDQWMQERYDKEQALHDQKYNNINSMLNATADFFGAVANFQEAAMSRELRAAAGNEKQMEAIQKRYFEKQKGMSIAQALINGALAVTNILANVPGSTINPLSWAAIGVVAATTAAQVAMISAQSFAKGGVVYGETLATVGDYPGAQSNPEVIAPLSDLKKLLKPERDVGLPKTITLVAKGDDLVATIDTERLIQNTY
jgi:hypothetical protein